MRKLLLFLLLIYTIGVNAQDCSEIEYSYDKFTNKKEYYTPMFDPESYPLKTYGLVCHKYITKGVSSYYLYANIKYSNPHHDLKGSTFILSNGSRIVRSSIKVECSYSVNDFLFSVMFKLTPEEISLLRKHEITDYKLGFLKEEDIEYSQKLNFYVNCLSSKK